MTNLSKGNHSQEQGFSLIEVLVSLLILGVGLLGLGGLQVASMKSTTNAHSRTVANMLITELADRMRANPGGLNDGLYAESVNCTTPEKACRINTFCTPEEVAKFDLQEIICGMKRGTKREGGVVNLLSQGVLEVEFPVDCSTVTNAYRLTISWGTNVIKQNNNVSNPQNNNSIVCITP